MSANPSPSPAGDSQFTEDLQRAADGDREARQRLWANHYETLHQCAKAWFAANWQRRGDKHGVSLDGTDIVHAAYERLHDRTAAMVNGKAFFFRVFYTECMRIVVDHYRRTRNDKGRGARKRLDVPLVIVPDQHVHVDFDAIYDLLAELERQDARVGQVAMLKVFESRAVDGEPGPGRGLTNAEVAKLLGIGLRTVEQDWAFAKAYLFHRLGDNKAG